MQYPMGSSDPCPVWRSMLKNSCYNEQNEWGEADAHEMTYYKFSGSTQNLKNIACKKMLEIVTFSLGLVYNISSPRFLTWRSSGKNQQIDQK